MSKNRVAHLLLITLVIATVQYGTSLECFVCTSIEDSACAESLSGIATSTCSLPEISEETSVPTAVTTTTSDSVTSSSSESTVTSVNTDATSTEYSSSESSSTIDSTITVPTTTLGSTITEGTTTETNTESTEDPLSFTTITEGDTTPSEIVTTTDSVTTTTTGFVTSGQTTDSSTVAGSSNLEVLMNNEPEVVRVVRDTDVEFACYTLTVIVDNETVTDRGCVVQSATMCETLNEEKYPEYDLETCTTCTEDGCNSSPITLSGISSLCIPLIMFILMS